MPIARRLSQVAALVLSALAYDTSAYADEPPPLVPEVSTPPVAPSLEDQLADLRKQQDALSRRLAEADARAAEAARQQALALKKAVSFSAAPGKGLTLTIGDLFSLSLRSRAQIRDTIIAQGGKPTTNEINVKTVRLWLQGYVLTKDLTYGLQLAFGGNDFEKDSSSPIFDAYVDYARLRDLNIRVGQFFVPFDRARTIREFGLQLVDRAQVTTELSLDRDVGLALSSQNLGGTRGILAYHVGFFGGEGKNRFGGAHVGFLYTARIVIRPFGAFDDDLEGDLQRLRRPRLAIGFAGAYNQNTNRQKSTFGNTLTLGVFDYGHAEADVVFKLAGVSFLGEILYRQARQGSYTGKVAGVDTREWSRSGYGYLLQVGVMVHDKVELAARYNQLYALGHTDPTYVTLVQKTGKEFDGGLNVYLNGHAFKIQTDYVYDFGDVVAHGKHSVRVQLDASF